MAGAEEAMALFQASASRDIEMAGRGDIGVTTTVSGVKNATSCNESWPMALALIRYRKNLLA
ncbi:MAG: hypothetical protein ACK55I_38350, partial [bacterium]